MCLCRRRHHHTEPISMSIFFSWKLFFGSFDAFYSILFIAKYLSLFEFYLFKFLFFSFPINVENCSNLSWRKKFALILYSITNINKSSVGHAYVELQLSSHWMWFIVTVDCQRIYSSPVEQQIFTIRTEVFIFSRVLCSFRFFVDVMVCFFILCVAFVAVATSFFLCGLFVVAFDALKNYSFVIYIYSKHFQFIVMHSKCNLVTHALFTLFFFSFWMQAARESTTYK